ncbi:MAG: alkaline phosphatase [Proteiniphilum sp.]|nr:alkaline phosphatase [Proteiniphilum sp.]MDD4158578.1 alkaline phosphatase [Proteiniphilum sp.]MDD4799960.1 alkaline phosphatase [Proteiniphilum sp.]
MRKIQIFFFLLLASATLFASEVRPVKNLIVMIPDGTSISVYSAARWFKYYNGLGERLNIDPYITGTVTTFSSNAPIGDSAPTSSAYATGVLQQTGNIAIHPEVSDNDLFPVDAARTWQPAATILEALKIEKHKAVGLVVTCEFPHATPADFSAHHYKRNNYKALAPQIAYQNLDVMFGGGNGILTDDIRQHFANNGTTLIQNDRQALLDYKGERKIWALFGEKALPYNIDRNPDKVPSLAEMTGKALELLSRNENGFFLMVEGSQVDWAAHANDPATMINEFLAFDEAVGKVTEFAKADGNTAVVILSDHGNSGFSIGSRRCSGYDRLSIAELFGTVSKFKLSNNGLESILIKTPPEKIKSVFKEYTGIDITQEELEKLLSSKNYKETDYMKVGTSDNLAHNIGDILNTHTCFGFTTGGHTGEEVLLAAYHPQGDVPRGNIRNTDLNRYLQQVTALDCSLEELSDRIFVKHDKVFEGMSYSINRDNPDYPVLMVKKGKTRIEIPAFSSVAKKNGKPFDIGSVVVYIDKNDTFYLPASLRELF